VSVTVRDVILLLLCVTVQWLGWIALMLHIYSPRKVKNGVAETKQKCICLPASAQVETTQGP